MNFAEYLTTLDQFKPAFTDAYRSFVLPPAIEARLQSLTARRHILVLTGGHCPDCHDFVPVFARLAECSNLIDVRFFSRSNHPVLAERFATREKHYIPTGVIMDIEFWELGRFVERPRLLKELIASGVDPQRYKRRGAFQMAAAEEIANLLFTSV